MINTQRPMTMQDLARVFSGGGGPKMPEQIGSDIFMGSPQGYDYLQGQGQNLGIGDPVQYFQHQKAAQQMANTPSGGMMEAMRLAGMHRPDSLPGQLAARELTGNKLMQMDAMQAKSNASLQQSNLDRQYPLPSPGSSLTLSPVMSAAMRQSGETNSMAWMMKQRLGANRGAVAPFSAVPDAGIKPEDLYNEPSFQTIQNSNPQKAAQVFQALTNQDLGKFGELYQSRQLGEQKFGIEQLRREFAENNATTDEAGELRFRKKVFDPTTNKMVATGEYEEGTPYQRNLKKYLPHVSSEIAAFKRLHDKGGPTAPVASLQNAPVATPYQNEQGVPIQQQASRGSSVFENTLRGVSGDLGRVFTGGEQSWLGGTEDTAARASQWGRGSSGDFEAPRGSAITHMRERLANNPQFQELLKRDPERARRLIMAMQRGSNSPVQQQPVYPRY